MPRGQERSELMTATLESGLSGVCRFGARPVGILEPVLAENQNGWTSGRINKDVFLIGCQNDFEGCGPLRFRSVPMTLHSARVMGGASETETDWPFVMFVIKWV